MSERRIVDLNAFIFRADNDSGVALSFGRMRHRQCLVLAVTDDEGRIGYGECWVNWPHWAPEERLTLLREGIAPLVVGRHRSQWDALPATVYAALERQYRQAGCIGPLWHAVSAVDQALWDLSGRPVPQVPVQVYASGLGPTGAVEDARRAVGFGVRTVKLRIGFGPSTDLGNLESLRALLADDIAIAVDANQSFSLADAVAFAAQLEPFGIGWIEEPIAGDRVEDLVRFHEATGLPVATGENVYELEDFVRRAESSAVHLLQPDVTKAGGITRALSIVAAVEHADVRIAPHMYGGPVGLAATLALAASSARVAEIEYDVRTSSLAALPTPVAGKLHPFADHAAALAHLDRDAGEVHRLLPSVPAVAGAVR